ncbi:MAG TPA: response regulator transcription factor [Candidatus Microthrix sp.]|nr:response regulator transcription factor [Candidatus Microthrix sp.]HMS46664.1 response regulator transcription factor [Candidatus Microthrix sp.]
MDDEPRLAVAVKRGLEAEGFAVDVAATGDEGLWMATEVAYDAIVLDIMLPGISGYTVCARLREAGVWTPILMLTAKNGEYDEAEALDTGADGYLSKPFSFVVLVAHIRALLRRGATERPAKLSLGDLVLDPATRSCIRGDMAIDLTAKEFSVLEFLMRSKGDVVTKSQIVEHVWDAAYDGDLNVVEVHVSALRRKIDAPFGTDTIRTVRGAGYQMVAP